MAISLLSPILGIGKRFHLPLPVAEISIGVFFGKSCLNLIPIHDPTLVVLSNIGFALVMMVTGSHIDLRKIISRKILATGTYHFIFLLFLAAAVSFGISKSVNLLPLQVIFIFILSSSAAVILPTLSKEFINNASNYDFIFLITITDLITLILVPFTLEHSDSSKRIFGILVLIGLSITIYYILKYLLKQGWLEKFREFSKRRKFGMELRISLALLLGLSLIATKFSVSIMVAGLFFGLALEPDALSHRLNRQLFGIAEGFFSPIFFIFLGAQLDFHQTFKNFQIIKLTIILVVATITIHALLGLIAHRPKLYLSGMATMGVPVSIISIGQQTHLLNTIQCDSIALASLITILIFAVIQSIGNDHVQSN
jgi:Kef-type K+ transport system membrane component KefB